MATGGHDTFAVNCGLGREGSGDKMSGSGSAERLVGSAQFYDRIGELQRRLRDCEMKRLELEKKLFQSSPSDAHLCHLRYMKLKTSLEEACEKEKLASSRNKAILQQFEVTEACLHALICRSSQDRKMLQVSRQAEISTSTDMSRRIYHPATIFMGRQMSANSSIEHRRPQRKSPQPTKSFSISDPHSVRQAVINSNLTDSCVVPANSDTQCLNKTDKIDGETSSSQIRQEMPVTSAASSGDAGTHHAEIDMTQSGRKHLAESKQSAQLSTQTQERLSPENRTGDLRNDSPGNKVEDSLMYERLVSNEERFTHANPSGSSPDACDYINKQASDNHSVHPNLSGNHQVSKVEDDEFLNSSSDLTVSISDSEEELDADDLLEAVDGKKETPAETQSSKVKAEPRRTNEESPNQFSENATDQDLLDESLSVSSISHHILSDKGFIHLLQSIEDMILQTDTKNLHLYQNNSLTPAKKDHLVSLCNQLKTLRKEDLEACCALVVQHLQKESSGGSLLEKSHPTQEDHGKERTISPLLQNHLLGHVSFLKEHGILKGGVPAGFAAALIPNDEMKSQQNQLRSASHGKDLTSISSTETDGSFLPKKYPLAERPLKPSQNEDHHKAKQDDTSVCEDDSRHGKFPEEKRLAAHVSATQAKALLKEDESEDDGGLSEVSEIEIPGLAPATGNVTRKTVTSKAVSEATLSSSESSPEHRKEKINTTPAPMTNWTSYKGSNNVKSKAFWGESEDSGSEIEAMLRPQTQNNDADDFDGFFD